MSTLGKILRLQILLLSAVLLLLIQDANAGKAIGKDGHAGRLSVMTQNLYVGSNLFQILGGEPEEVPINAAKIFSDIQFTDFQQRAVALADLIAKKRPHLIGLQEVSLIRVQCPDDIVFPPNDLEPNATEVYADYLQILLDALEDRNQHYEIAAMVQNADVELPTANVGGNLLPGCEFPLFDARLTDFDVTLRRSDVQVSNVIAANYTNNLPVPTPAGDIVFTRGYNIMNAEVQGRTYRVVNTHLEVSGNPFANLFQLLQAAELVGILDSLASVDDQILVVMGDFNSSPADGQFTTCIVPPEFTSTTDCPTPYAILAGSGFVDTWWLRNGAMEEGNTCCQDDLLTNDESALYERIDQVWVRPPVVGAQGPHFINAIHSDVLGDQQKDRTVDGLWPSDHAGVAVGMTFRLKK